MFNEKVFDTLLREGTPEEAFGWCLTTMKEYPWFLRLKAMTAFGAAVDGRWETAHQIVREVEPTLHDNVWVKAVFFVQTDEVWPKEIPWYLGGREPLDATWVLRLFCLGFDEHARRLCRLIMVHGNPEDQELLRRDVLFNTVPDDVM